MWWVAAALAQSPSDGWRTVRTEHYRLHYPAAQEAWAQYTAQRLEAVRERVVAEVGWAPERPTEVIVTDSLGVSNGLTFVQPRRPRVLLFTTPPDPSDGLANYRTWTEDLVTHEDAHVVHLRRPSRNPALRLLTGLANLGGPVSFAPAWVLEGYATVVEGRLTGSGRPNAATRAVMLRRLAASGALPEYAALDSGAGRWEGRSYRYLVGSAFLEWAEARARPGALRDLWARMTAREIRSFDEAFSGVFGEPPAVLYGRFVAEATADALRIEGERPPDEGTLWQDWAWDVAPPALSPDGSRLVVLRAGDKGPSRLEVYATGPDDEARERWEKANLPDREADPQDVDPVRPAVYPREAEADRTLGGLWASHPRWIDEERVLFTSLAGRGGDLRPDLFEWRTDGGIRRITRGAAVRDADPQGDLAYAVRVRGGTTELVRVSLLDGSVEPLGFGAPDPGVVYAGPRVRGDTLVWLVNRGQGWRIERAVFGGTPQEVPLPPGAQPQSVGWSGDALVASLGVGGFQEIYRLGDAGWERVTQTMGGAFSPASAADGVFYLVPGPDGYDLHRRSFGDARAADPSAPAAEVEPLAPAPIESRRYGLGRPSVALVAASAVGPGEGVGALGFTASDPIGRYEVVGLVGVDDLWPRPSVSGGRASVSWRGAPVYVRLEAAVIDDAAFASADLLGATVGHRARLDWRASGVWVDRGWAADAAIGGAARRWSGAAWFGAGGTLAGRWSPDIASTGRARGWVGVGAGSAGLFAEGELARGALSWGGVPNPLLPEAAASTSVWAPGLAPSAGSSSRVDRLRAALDAGPVEAFVARDATPGGGYARAGLEATFGAGALPFLAVPGLDLSLGAACRLETPEDGWLRRPCRTWTDYVAWAWLTVRPGRDPLLPAERRFR